MRWFYFYFGVFMAVTLIGSVFYSVKTPSNTPVITYNTQSNH